ncbi:uncharacterized protein LOC111867829 isoform X2 [Cryptotermes secundus]|uniref:uncharacterized protein LOC111867829 isoform X2 n=1 Tax=Cryptotermes secundus TaxID=105785 RepID=UPI000CD7C479|nr:uncharacterized protein LOC111867829 isoform X2 [Cryptotermes secundus]
MMSGIDFGLRKENLGSLPQTPSAMILPTGDKKNAGTPRERLRDAAVMRLLVQAVKDAIYIELNKDLLRGPPEVSEHTEKCTSIPCVTGLQLTSTRPQVTCLP